MTRRVGCRIALILPMVAWVGIGVCAAQTNVTVTITTDNAYVFGFGTVSGITSLNGGIDNCTAGAISSCSCPGPETYTIANASLNGYIYIAAWSDDFVNQGVLAQFTDGTTTVLTSPSVPWEVYATGQNIDPSCVGFSGCGTPGPPSAPSMSTINGYITTANSAGAWQNAASGFLAFGEQNNNNFGTFPIVCNIASNAQWMWRNPNQAGGTTNPFSIGAVPNLPQSMSVAQEFLIFRVGPIGPLLQPCIKPPSGMVGWWPLDETAGPVAHELVATRDGTQTGNFTSASYILGEVNGAYRLSSTSYPYQHVDVPDYPVYDFTTSFTIDAWIRLTQTTGAARAIVDKESGPNGFQVTGYQLFLDNTERLGFELGSGGAPSQNVPSQATGLSHNVWHHVAVTVNQTVSPPTSQLYLDGAPLGPVFVHTGISSIVNSSHLYIGQRTVGGYCPFGGDIDEVEIFCQALSAAQIQAIYNAGSAGKCKLKCTLPGTLGFCPQDSTEKTTLTICNQTGATSQFNWSMAGLLASQCGNLNGPTSFTPPNDTPNLPPGCTAITVTVGKPAGLTAGSIACYRATVQSAATGQVVQCTGQVVPELRNICCAHSRSDGIHHSPLNSRDLLYFDVTNTSGSPISLDYRFEELSTDEPPFFGIMLNDHAPGTPATGSISIPANTTIGLPVIVTPIKSIRFEPHQILLSAELSGFTPLQPLASASIETEDTDLSGTVVTVIVPAVGTGGMALLILLIVSWGISYLHRKRPPLHPENHSDPWS